MWTFSSTVGEGHLAHAAQLSARKAVVNKFKIKGPQMSHPPSFLSAESLSKPPSVSVEGKASLPFTMAATGVEKEEVEAQLKLYSMILGAAQPMALRAAVLLNIPHIIALHGHGGSLSLEGIASHISSAPHMERLFRILRFLASTGVFTQTPAPSGDINQCRFGLTALSKLLLPGGRSCAPLLLLLTDKLCTEPWHHLYDSVVEGCHAFTKCHGMDMWEYANKHPQANRIFNEGMASDSRAVMSSLLGMYEGFRDVKTLVDVGGGVGSAISQIVEKYNHIRGINYDLPHVIASAPPIPGVEHVAGNMFEHIPSADAIFMKWILHDWDDEDCVRVLKKCHEALPPNGKVIVVDAMVEGGGEGSNLGVMFDLLMMALSPGGKERTEDEFRQLFLRAGFREHTVTKLPFLQSIIELTK